MEMGLRGGQAMTDRTQRVGGAGEGCPSPEADAAGAALAAGKASSSPAPLPGGTEGVSGSVDPC
jgi:hypothetical protein